MEEVEGVIKHHEYDYSKLKGQTGPLVYPGGFVWLFSFFYWITNNGTNILLAQWIYCFIYLLTTIIIFNIYYQSKQVYRIKKFS